VPGFDFVNMPHSRSVKPFALGSPAQFRVSPPPALAGREYAHLWTTARTFALLNAALADSYIAGWDSKMHYNFWRPISAIRLASDDGNRATAPDTTWEPFLTTPPVQDYPSTHSVLGSAGAVVLAHAFGRDDIAFTFTSLSADSANPVRSFRSFSQAARENAESRIMAGIHFRFAIEAGLALGQDIGRYTVATLFGPTVQAVSDASNE